MSDDTLNFRRKNIKNSRMDEPAFQVYLDESLVAEVRGSHPVQATIIPMRELNDHEESKLHEFIGTSLLDE